MATVYLADDLKHERKVALKCSSQNWLPLSGPSDSWPRSRRRRTSSIPTSCLSMIPVRQRASCTTSCPTSEGDTLRDKIDREKQLPV